MKNDSWKLIDLLNTATAYLEEKAIENPRRNAETMLGKALAIPRIELYLQYDRPLQSEEVGDFRAMIRRRINREPLQQIIGEIDFLGCRIVTPKGLLVPRPETELLAEKAVSIARQRFGIEDTIKVLDLGCGTGCLSVSIASSLPKAAIDATDIDPDAIDITRENAGSNGVEDRIRALRSDMLSEELTSELLPPYDLIISNPPYVREAEYEQLAPEIRNFENPAALIGGKDGLLFYQRIAELLPMLLSDSGFAMIELGYDQAKSVSEIISAQGLATEALQDLNGIERMLLISRNS